MGAETRGGGTLGTIIGLITGLGGLFKHSLDVGRMISSAINVASQALSKAIKFVFDVHHGLLHRFRIFLKDITAGGWKGVIPGIIRKIGELRARILKLLDPLIRYLERARRFWDLTFNLYLRPILVLIEQVRSALVVFRIFGLKFAQALDGYAADLEARIFKLSHDQRIAINRILTFLDLLVDPPGLINARVFLGNLGRSIDDIVRITHHHQVLPGFSFNFRAVQQQAEKTVRSRCDKALDRLVFTRVTPETALDRRIRERCEKALDELLFRV